LCKPKEKNKEVFMRRIMFVWVFGVCLGLFSQVNPDTLPEKYVKKVILKIDKPGRGPKEIGFRMWEGEPDYPTSIVADSDGRIYILDHLNNRVVVLDTLGKFIREIPVKVYEEASLEEIKKTPYGLAFAKLYGKEMYIKDDVIYIPVRDGFFVNSKLVKIIKIYISQNWKVEEEKPSQYKLNSINLEIKGVKGKEVKLEDKKIEGYKAIKIMDIKTKETKVIKLPEPMSKIYIDQKGDIYAVNHGYYIAPAGKKYDENHPAEYSLVVKYSIKGKELARVKIPYSVGIPFITGKGEIVALCRIPMIDTPQVPSHLNGMKVLLYRAGGRK